MIPSARLSTMLLRSRGVKTDECVNFDRQEETNSRRTASNIRCAQ
jgi:hypothetical protein